MIRSQKVAILAFLVPLVTLVAWIVYHETRIPQNQGEVLNRMIELQREGRYDKAVEVVQKWMKDGRRNIANDDFMYGQIAMVYIIKAYKRPGSREDSVQRAQDNLDKELNSFEQENHGEVSVQLFEIGGGYETLGDLSDQGKCNFYEKARQAFLQQLPLITEDSYTAYGKTMLLEPVRGDVRKHLDSVNEKSSKAGCQLH
jgi:tetratricopeptide (TPR) repeat protein